MPRLANIAVAILILFLAVFTGCQPLDMVSHGMSGLKSKPKPAAPANPPAAQPGMVGLSEDDPPGTHQLAHDPVRPINKTQVGINYDPYEFVEGQYNPDTIAARITSPGFRGLTQQTFAEAGGDHNVNVDRTGKWMVFASTRYSVTPQICMQNVRGLSVRLLTEDRMSDMMPAFSPRGDLIAWSSNRYGNWDILVEKVDATPDSRPRQLTNSTDDDIHPSWSQDQNLVAFSRFNSMDGLWQIWVMDFNNRTLSYITEGLFPEFRPIPEENGIYTIAYQRHRRRDVPWYSIWTIKVRMGKDGAVEAVNSPEEIVANDQWAAITPVWSPDGQCLAFASVRKSPLAQWQARIYKADDIWTVRINGTDLTQITNHSAPDWDPWWAAEEGNPVGRLYFTSLRSGHPNIWSVRPLIAGLEVAQAAGGMTGTQPKKETE